MRSEVPFIGIQISADGFRPLDEKVSAIDAIEMPQNAKSLRRFLGMCGFYHRFVPKFSDIASPLTDMTKGYRKNSKAKLQWTDVSRQAFVDLKLALKRSVKLAFPSPEAHLELTTDASASAAGAVLNQVRNGVKEPIAFFSRKFTENEAAKSAFDRELLAVYMALRNFEWLLGQEFTIVTDHKPLAHALAMKNPNSTAEPLVITNLRIQLHNQTRRRSRQCRSRCSIYDPST